MMEIDNLCVFRLFSNDGNMFYYADEEGGNYIGTTILELVDEAVKSGQAIVHLTQSPMTSGMSMGAVITPRVYRECIDDWTKFRLTGVLEERHPRLSVFARRWTRKEFHNKHAYIHLCEFEELGLTIPSIRNVRDGEETIRARLGCTTNCIYQAREGSRAYFMYVLDNEDCNYYSSRYPELFDGIVGIGQYQRYDVAFASMNLERATLSLTFEDGDTFEYPLDAQWGINQFPKPGSNTSHLIPSMRELVIAACSAYIKEKKHDDNSTQDTGGYEW